MKNVTKAVIIGGSLLVGAVLLALAFGHEPYIRVKNIKYGPHKLHKYDVYYKENFENAPIIILVHGGGWGWGQKEFVSRTTEFFVNQGCVVMTPNYRLSGYRTPERYQDPDEAYCFPIHVKDVACSIVKMKKNAWRYGGDKDKVILWGTSAGSQIAGMIAYDQERDWLVPPCSNTGENLDVIGYIGVSGVYDFDALRPGRTQPGGEVEAYLCDLFGPGNWNEAEPINFVDSSDPPCLIVHGDADCFLNPGPFPDGPCTPHGSMAFAEAVNNATGLGFFYLMPDATHGTPNHDILNRPDLQEQYINFLNMII